MAAGFADNTLDLVLSQSSSRFGVSRGGRSWRSLGLDGGRTGLGRKVLSTLLLKTRACLLALRPGPELL